MAENTLKFIVEVDASKGAAALKGFAKEYGANVTKMKNDTSGLGGGVKQLGGVMTTVFAGAAATAVISFGKKAVAAYTAEEDAINRLSVALKNQGQYSKAQVEQLRENASQLQANSRYGDDLIMDMQALGLRYGIQAKDLDRATQAAVDFAAATGKDLRTAFELVGKAAGGNTALLGRYGIQLDDNIPKAEKFEAALSAMNKQFGGAAQADVNTLGGQLEQLRNKFGDLMEVMGSQLVPALKFWGNELGGVIDFWQSKLGGAQGMENKEMRERNQEEIYQYRRLLELYKSGEITEETKKLKGQNKELDELFQKSKRIRDNFDNINTLEEAFRELLKQANIGLKVTVDDATNFKGETEGANTETEKLIVKMGKLIETTGHIPVGFEKMLLDLGLFQDQVDTMMSDIEADVFREREGGGKVSLFDEVTAELDSQKQIFDDFAGSIGQTLSQSITQGMLTGEMNFKDSIDRMKEYFLSQLVEFAIFKVLGSAFGIGGAVPAGNIFGNLFKPQGVGDLILTSRGEAYQTAPDDSIHVTRQRPTEPNIGRPLAAGGGASINISVGTLVGSDGMAEFSRMIGAELDKQKGARNRG